MLQEPIAVTNNVIYLPFQASNIPDAAGSAVVFGADFPEHAPMLLAGSLIGLSVRHNADLSGGVITWKPTINGVAVTGLQVVTEDTVQQAVAMVEAGVVPFPTLARIGLAWTKTGTVAPTTTDVIAGVYALLHDWNF